MKRMLDLGTSTRFRALELSNVLLCFSVLTNQYFLNTAPTVYLDIFTTVSPFFLAWLMQ